MPRWQVEAPDGTRYELEGDQEPTEQELDDLFSPPKAPERPPVPVIPQAPGFESPLGITTGGPIYRSQLQKNIPAPAPSIYEEPTPVEEAVAPVAKAITTPLHKFEAPARDTVERILAAPAQLARDRLEMSPDDQEHPVLEKIAQTAPSDKAIDIATGVGESAADMASFFTSPMGIATLAMGGYPAAVQRGIALAFAADMGRQVPEIAQQLGDELGKPEDQRDYTKIAKLTTDAAQMMGFSALSAAHGLGARADLPMPRSRDFAGPLQTGAALPPPAPRGVPVSVGTPALPGIAERTVADLGGPQEPLPGGPLPVRPPRGPIVPGEGEGAAEIPPPAPIQGPAAPPAAWDDFVADTRRRGRADMTIPEIQALFPDQRPNREAARRLRDEAFGRPGGAGEVPPVEATAPTPPPEPPVPELPTIEEMNKRAEGAGATHVSRLNGKDSFRFTDPTAEPGKPNQITFSVPAGADKKTIDAARKLALVRTRVAEGIPDQNIQIMVNKLPAPFESGSYVQVDEVGHPRAGNVWSANPEVVNQAGMEMPNSEEFLKLPNGRYTLPEALAKLKDLQKSAETTTHIDPTVAPTVEVPLDQIIVNKDVPNFKGDADPKTGVVPAEKLESGKYERIGTAPIVLWKKANGELEIITGRHRLDLARRTGEKTIPAQVVEEAKGFTKEMAMTFDAEANIRDGQGSVRDYAHYFKGSPDLTEAEARQRGLLSRAKGKAGWDLAKTASDDLYALWRDDKITEARALAIARAAPGDAAKQQLGIKLAQEGRDPDYIRARLERERAKTESPVQTDMFGNPVFDDAKADEEADRVVQIRKDLRDQIRAVQAAAKNPEAAAKLGVDVKDPAGVLKKVEALKAELEKWDGAWWLDKDLVAKVKGEAKIESPISAPPKKPEPPKPPEAPAQPPKPPETPPVKPLFGPEEQARIDEIRKKLRDKLGGVSSTDPELFTLGAELAFRYLRAGVRKFNDFATHMINELGEGVKDYLLSWYNNARLQLKDIAHELDPEPEAERQWQERYGKRTEGGPEVSGPVGGGGEQRGRPGIRISRKELIPEPRQYVTTHSYAKGGNFGLGQQPFILDSEQVRGINLILDRFTKNPKGGAFVLADGTGFGKTAQLLAVADQYRKMGLGQRVLIVTENKTVARVRFGGDAERMGIDPDSYTITTYTSIGKHPPTGWDLVLFDEAHNLKNPDAQKSIKAARLDAKHTVFATATPMDKPTGAAYFLAEITGKDENQIAHDLGYQIVEREDPITHEPYQSAVLLPTMTWQKVWANIMAHRDAAIRDGAMIRREYPFYGDVAVEKMFMDRDRKTEHDAIAKYYDDLVKKVRNPTARRNFAGQKTLELGRWAEQAKLDDAVRMAVEHIKSGGQAIIVCETDKPQSFSQPIADSKKEYRTTSTGREKEVWVTDGAITKLKKMLADQGITDIADIHDPKAHDIPLQVRQFQSGQKRVALATPQSGGTGIDLDDQTGNRPRLMIALSKNMAGDKFEQLVGRVSRKNTLSPAQVRFLDLQGSFGDERRNAILNTKIKTLKAIQGGEELDVAGGFKPGEEGGGGGGGAAPLINEPPGSYLYSGIPMPDLGAIWDDVTAAAKVALPWVQREWRSFSMQSLPRITHSSQEAGEAGVRVATAPMVARAKGLQFAAEVKEGTTDPQFDMKFGTGLTEDNLRDLKAQWNERADEAENRDEIIDDLREQAADLKDAANDGDPDAIAALRQIRAEISRLKKLTDDDVIKFRANADNVTTTIGAQNSPFPTEAAYRAFMESPETQAALARHISLWESRKDPLFREANDLDPDLDLPTRGLDYGARINLKNILRDQGTPTTVGPAVRSPLIRATATLRRTDPFGRPAMGAGSYDGSYQEIMANGFAREYPVAKQHEFIRKLLAAGDAVIKPKEYMPELELKGESTKGYPLRYRPWANQHLQIRRSLAKEYEDAMGLSAAVDLGTYTKAANLFTRMSVQGLAEGSTHISNLLMQVFTGLGPTGNPMLNALVKSAGRADVIYSLPKVLINAFADRKADMLALAEIGAAKEPYKGAVGWLITKIDQGVRLYAADVYKKLARNGWVEDSETGLREFVNQVGQYNKRLQPRWIQHLRSTGIQPFATAMQTFNVQGLRTMVAAPGVRGIEGGGRTASVRTPTTQIDARIGGHSAAMANLALRADKAAGVMGFAVLVSTLNYMVSGTAAGPKGTRLGAVGWIGDDKKLHQLDLGALTGISRGARITGLQPFVEQKRIGAGTGSALTAGAQGAANTFLSAATGPINRWAFMAMTGKRPALPGVKEARVIAPQRDFHPLRTQVAANILEASKQANPLVDMTVRMGQGKYEEAIQRQLSRYYPRTGMSAEQIESLPKIIQAGELNQYVDALKKEARKQTRGVARLKFVNDKMKEDNLDPGLRLRAMRKLQRDGVFTH